MGQLVCNEVEATVMVLSVHEAESIDFASAFAAVERRGARVRKRRRRMRELTAST
jgi:hypothetical protein